MARLSTRLALAMVGLVLLTATSMAILIYRNIEAIAVPRALERMDTRSRLVAGELEASVRGTRADVTTQGRVVDALVSARTAGGIHPLDGTPEAQLRERLTSRFVAELKVKPAYSQYRLIGAADGGREIVRVDRMGPGGAIRVVPDAELQRKGDRDYFKAAIRLPAGEVYASPIDFNQENGVIEVPHVPTLRVAAPVLAPDGKPFGILIINVDLRAAFDRVRSTRGRGGATYVVNGRGDYLVHPDAAREFGFELGKPTRLQDDFPELTVALAASRPEPRIVRDVSGVRFGVAMAPVRLADERRVIVVESMPYSAIVAGAVASIRDSTLLAGLAAVLIAIALALLIARSLSQPLIQITRSVEGFSRGNPIIVPRNAKGEIGVLARAFVQMAADLRERTSALNSEMERHRRIFESSLDLILVVDKRGTFVQVSPSCADILDYQPEEMVGHSAAEFLYPEDLDNTRNEMRLARRGRQMRNFECRYVHKAGRIVPLSWMGVWSEPVQLHFFIGRDMTESKKAQEKLRESEQMARGIIDTALDAFVQMDEAGYITDWSPQAAALFGWSRDEAIGQVLFDLIMPVRHRARHVEGLKHFLAGSENPIIGRRVVVTAVRRDGQEMKVELSTTALRRGGGYLFNGFIRDLTDKLAAEEQFRQAQKMEAVGQLTGGVAHDFNNILTVITGTIDILGNAVADQADLAEIAKMIEDAAQRGAELTQRLLAFARKQPLQPHETEINTLVMDAAKLLRPTLGENIEIESIFEEDAWPALVDPNQLTTAILNLALNARDAMPNGGQILLETRNVQLDEAYATAHSDVRPGSYVMIGVSDTGSGIPAALREKVFEPFFTTKETGKGTGLGLSMVYGFVKQSGGHIKIYSEEGHGTTVRLYLPKSTGLGDQMPAMSSAVEIKGGEETILVVEDDPLVRKYVVGQLRSLGYAPLAAANAAEAIAIIDGGTAFDLLFTDVIMPGPMNGPQLADEARKRRPALRVLFTSGYTENAIMHHGRLDPGVLLLAKPYRQSDLARMIRIALGDDSVTAGDQAARRSA